MIRELFVNLLILFIPVFCYQSILLLNQNSQRDWSRLNRWIIGFVSGISASLCMYYPIVFGTGFLWDLRWLPILFANLYGGMIGGIFASIIVTAFRAYFGEGVSFEICILVAVVLLVSSRLFQPWFSSLKLRKKLLASISYAIYSYAIVMSGIVAYFISQNNFQFIVSQNKWLYVWLAVSYLASMSMMVFMIERMLDNASQISDRIRIQNQLKKAEELYTLISENSQDVISCSRPDGICQFVSPAVRHTLGYEPEEWIGKVIWEFWHAEDTDSFFQQKLYENDRFQCRVRHKTGHYIWFETGIKMIRDEQGDVQLVLGVGRDISAQKRVEEKLRQSESSLKLAHRIAKIGNWEWEFGNNILVWSEEFLQIFGLDLGRLQGTLDTISERIHPEDLDKIRSAVQDARNSGAFSIDYRIIRPDGTVRIIHSLGEIFSDETREPCKLIGTIQDITEQKKAEEFYLKTEKLSAMGQLAASVAHEIRNPLTALKGFLQLLKPQLDGQKKQYFEIMQTELHRVELITSELLMMGKPQAVRYETCSATRILTDVIMLYSSQALMDNVQILTDFEVEPFIECEENQIKQVFINLIKNAIESMSAGGCLTIRVHQAEGHLARIEFADQGIGIPANILKKLGEPFYTTKEKGTGLGLMVTKKIIEDHNGNLQIESQVGIGTTVIIELPAEFSSKELIV